ncbi:glycerol-3-phosphate dehydrogenase [Caenibius tardaugens NBRC 16725]|uniref:Glycerol-3-phosphate dehydrogenase n=1 Tax=Caenibius tardaugens NBRC 16725 TaxID=1219035 RepID=U2ZYY9_9SPHN|nr:glycerol-3-phosphate dehydrogenase [Caenibius tardaugens]AZI35821.1 glycerol-3-phosphate dehydrogenase [Caenibius tardaugens NBRC 16725]GAD50604.1 glycerol-3-phosphate dehydrogenase [Caenibius tardaugens NBRC 16725]
MTNPYDLIVIGGGVNGAGIARDAAGRGGRVLLLEARDLANGTSSASTKLVHGGLRYLEYREFALVREALQERETLWRIAPHIVRPMRFVLPHAPGLRPRWMLRAGLWLYDHIGGRSAWPHARAIRLGQHPAGVPLDPALTHGFEYSDGWVDDARLVVLNAKDAAERGADIRTHTPVMAARREAGMWVVETPAGQFHGRALVNAGGPGADDVARLAGGLPRYTVRRVRGSHIVTRKLFDHPYAYIFQLPDTRICFAIPYEGAFTLIGTTDRDHTGSLVDVSPDADEIAYLCTAASRYFRQPVTPDDVVWRYAGVRALVDDRSGRPEAATRGYRLPLSDPEKGAPLLGVYGGKITSYRHLSEAAVNRLAERLPQLSGKPWTADAALPGGDFPAGAVDTVIAGLQADYPFLDPVQATRIARAYGTRAGRWLGHARSRADLGRDFGAGLSEAELDYLRREEWAQSGQDVLWRRSKLGLHMTEDQRAAVADWFE